MSGAPRPFRSTRPADPGRRAEEDVRVLSGVVLRLTAKALRLEVYGEPEWLPLSQIRVRGELAEGEQVEVEVPGWKVRQLMKARREEGV